MEYYIYSTYVDWYGRRNYNKETESKWYSAYGNFITHVSSRNCISCRVTYLDVENKEQTVLKYEIPKNLKET